MAMNLKPLADRVIVEPLEKDEVTSSGIYLPETAKEKPQEGRVLAIGPGRTDDSGKRTAMEVAVDDKVIYLTGNMFVRARPEEMLAAIRAMQ